jgi:hypothetical protein
MIQIILRAYDPGATIKGPNNWKGVRRHTWVQLFFVISALLLIFGFILLNVVLIDIGEEGVGAAGSILVGLVGVIGLLIGLRTRKQ